MIGEMTRTKAVVYILPMLEENREFFGFGKELMNVYMFEESYPGIDGYIYLLYRIPESIFMDNETGKRVASHKRFVDYYAIYVSKGYSMVVFELPTDYIYDIKKFWDGKFSEFTDFYKMVVLDFHGAIPNSILHGILGKLDKTKKDLEKRLESPVSKVQIPEGMDLDSKPIITKETFFLKDLSQFEQKKNKQCDSIHSDLQTDPVSTSKRRRRRPGLTS
jgi:hypothetical protein